VDFTECWPGDRPVTPSATPFYTHIDHVVLNVANGNLESAVSFYEKTLGFQRQQTFNIQTHRSGLHSQVMVHPHGGVQLPINEPSSENSQIQEFLNLNRGPGIQHIALATHDILQAVAQLRASGLSFIQVPPRYYRNLQQRQGFRKSAAQWAEIEAQEILVDWHSDDPEKMLLQTFTQPIFSQPTFFFESIERRCQAQGFGEGNFQALFQAIEQEQIKREK
jgi:4-hydroxyphenylpyruvate dioxygenase